MLLLTSFTGVSQHIFNSNCVPKEFYTVKSNLTDFKATYVIPQKFQIIKAHLLGCQ